jgi:hypothetical protein
MTLHLSDRVSKNSPIQNFMKTRPAVAELLPYGKTDRNDEANSRFFAILWTRLKRIKISYNVSLCFYADVFTALVIFAFILSTFWVMSFMIQVLWRKIRSVLIRSSDTRIPKWMEQRQMNKSYRINNNISTFKIRSHGTLENKSISLTSLAVRESLVSHFNKWVSLRSGRLNMRLEDVCVLKRAGSSYSDVRLGKGVSNNSRLSKQDTKNCSFDEPTWQSRALTII